jgi:hypothetical protein
MPVGIWNLEWLNHNSQRSYPLAEDATKVDLTGTFTLPDNFILGLYFPVHAGLDVDVENFFVASVSVFATGYNISIGYNDPTAGTTTIVASAIISQSTHTPNTSYALPGIYPFDDSVGKIVIGVLDSINLQPAGQFLFDYAGGKLDSDAIRPMIRGIQSIRVLNNGELSAPITGHVILSAGSNFQLLLTQVTGQPTQITFNAIDGTGLTSTCECEGTVTGPIMTINGIGPTPTGNFSLVGSQCLDIEPATNGLQLTDTCSSPCCGCAELEQITHEIEMIGTGEATLENFVNQLAAQMNTFSQVVLGSRLADQGCVQCS